MRDTRHLGNKNKRADMAFLIYFTVMALLYTKTYIQLAAQLGIIVYVTYDFLLRKELKSRKAGLRNAKFMVLWFGLFTFWAMLSTQWAYSTMKDSNTLLTLFRITVVALVLFAYTSNYDKAVSVLKSFIYSNVIMAVAALITTPLSQYGQAGDDEFGFGSAIGQHRNIVGAVMAFLILICVLFYQYEHFRYGKSIAAFFLIVLLCSGSRGAMLQIVIIACLYVVTMPGMVKKLKYITMAILVAIIAVIILQNVTYLYETVWVRFSNMISTVLGLEEQADSSAYGRELYKVLAGEMFRDRPWFGHGVDGFYCMLRDVQFVDGYYLPPRYSHCNYTEIAANFGLVGLVIWYIPVLSILWGSFKLRKKAPQMNMIFIVLTSMVILDYARIPWANHIGMYTYFCIILLYMGLKREINMKRLYRSKFGTL